MTLQPSTLAFTGGVVALLFAAINIGGVREAIIGPPLPKASIAAASVRGFTISNAFPPVLFGVLSLVFPHDLVETDMGMSLCAGMAIYFGLRGWAFAISPEIRAGGPYLGTYALLLAAVCYAAAAVWGSVI
jgi:hypothetical protein